MTRHQSAPIPPWRKMLRTKAQKAAATTVGALTTAAATLAVDYATATWIDLPGAEAAELAAPAEPIADPLVGAHAVPMIPPPEVAERELVGGVFGIRWQSE